MGQLVGFATESRTPNTELIDLYVARAVAAGGVVDTIAGPQGRANLHVRFGPDQAGGVLLSGHTDVVPAGHGWSTDPYLMSERDGRFYGRGTADMKGFLATALAVIEEVDVDKLAAPVHFGLSYDEEIGCVGVRGLLDRLVEGERCEPELIVVGEPTTLNVSTAHSGKVAYDVVFATASGHSSRAPIQVSAIAAATELAASINALNRVGVSANIGTIAGGIAVNVLSPRCELTFEVRHAADERLDDVLGDLWAHVERLRTDLDAAGGSIELEQTIGYPALRTDPVHSAVATIAGIVGGGSDHRVSYGCEAGLYAEALPAPAVVFGPGDIADAHRPDEFVDIADLVRCADVVHQTVLNFCTK